MRATRSHWYIMFGTTLRVVDGDDTFHICPTILFVRIISITVVQYSDETNMDISIILIII